MAVQIDEQISVVDQLRYKPTPQRRELHLVDATVVRIFEHNQKSTEQLKQREIIEVASKLRRRFAPLKSALIKEACLRRIVLVLYRDRDIWRR